MPQTITQINRSTAARQKGMLSRTAGSLGEPNHLAAVVDICGFSGELHKREGSNRVESRSLGDARK